MKKEFWRKAPQCDTCRYHCLGGKREDSIDTTTEWNEACHRWGYSFWPELEQAAICFDAEAFDLNVALKNKTDKEIWVKTHLCSQCAFYERNGEAYVDPPFKSQWDTEASLAKKKEEEWAMQHRCHGYANDPAHDKSGFCSSFLTIPQWAEVEALPIYNGERKRKWAEFKEMNLRNHA